jgi:hypothetical protein
MSTNGVDPLAHLSARHRELLKKLREGHKILDNQKKALFFGLPLATLELMGYSKSELKKLARTKVIEQTMVNMPSAPKQATSFFCVPELDFDFDPVT